MLLKETSIDPNIKCPATLMKYFSCEKWWRHQSSKVFKALIDQRNNPLTFLSADSCFHGWSISPAPFVCRGSCLCRGFQFQSVCWGRERCFLCPEVHGSGRGTGRWTVGDTGAGVALWRWAGGAETCLFYGLNRAGGTTQMALRWRGREHNSEMHR